jgi:hypothetical protein
MLMEKDMRTISSFHSSLVLSLLAVFLLGGCSLAMRWPQMATYENAVNECPENGARTCATLFVSQEDLDKVVTVRFGFLGLDKGTVPVGKIMTSYGQLYLDEVLKIVNFNKEVKGACVLRLGLKSYNVSGASGKGKAEVEIRVSLTSPTGQGLLSKVYKAEGSGYVSDGADERQQARLVVDTTKEAFRDAFGQAAADLKTIRTGSAPAREVTAATK